MFTAIRPLDRQNRQLAPVSCAELLFQMGAVALDRLGGEPELLRDLMGSEAAAQQRQHVALAIRQALEGGSVSCRTP